MITLSLAPSVAAVCHFSPPTPPVSRLDKLTETASQLLECTTIQPTALVGKKNYKQEWELLHPAGYVGGLTSLSDVVGYEKTKPAGLS